MFRPKRNAGQARPTQAPATEDIYQPSFQSARNVVETNTSAAPRSTARRRTMFPLAASASRPARQDMLQPVSQPTNNAGANRTLSTQTFFRPPRFLSSARGNPGPTNASAASTSRTAVQPPIQPTRALPTQNPSVSSSRISRQPAFRPVRSTAAPVNTPAPSTSSSIREFICLYSHDLRRKTKRWQDGKLKFHTFNKKYVVYDDGGGFVGDGHWQGDESEFTEGLEMKLDRGMVIVQVLECTGSKELDLGEVLGKRAREVEERRVNAAAKNPASTASSNPAKRSRGIAAAVVQAAPAPVAPVTTIPAISLPSNGGAWSKHAVDLLGMTRPCK